MILYKKLLIVALVSIFVPLSKGHAGKRSSIDLEILGKPILAIKNEDFSYRNVAEKIN